METELNIVWKSGHLKRKISDETLSKQVPDSVDNYLSKKSKVESTWTNLFQLDPNMVQNSVASSETKTTNNGNDILEIATKEIGIVTAPLDNTPDPALEYIDPSCDKSGLDSSLYKVSQNLQK